MQEATAVPKPLSVVGEKRKPKAKNVNPIEGALRAWLQDLPQELVESIGLDLERLLEAAPKRWIVYPPMVLLPSGSFNAGVFAQTEGLEKKHLDALWKEILIRVGKREGKGVLTHLAVNSGIPLKDGIEKENVLRTPSGLVMLYGDFGPALSPERPSEEDFKEAFWVSTRQNGITQVWAPRYTMFSRGNVKEKARLLSFHSPSSSNQSLPHRSVSKAELGEETAVDLYAGIGYFAFSYVQMGIGRVLGWELNPWSVEGLRRGSVANGWSVKIVRADERWADGGERIVVFEEDNERAVQRLEGLSEGLGRVSHVNGGLLPTSQASWKMSLDILEGSGWLHLHENVGVNDVEQRKVEIEAMFQGWLKGKDERTAKAEHVEFVKTFAPGVWHCVFDVYISSP